MRPGETDEVLRTDASALSTQAAKDQARAAVKFAEAAAESALNETEKAKHGQSMLTEHERKWRLARAYSRVVAAKRALKIAERRSDLITEFIRGTWPWLDDKINVYRHSLLLQWILDKVFVIEAELNQPEMRQSSSYEGPNMETPRRDQDGRIEENRRSSRLKRRREMNTCGVGALTPESRPSKGNRSDDAGCDGPSAKRLRNTGTRSSLSPCCSWKRHTDTETWDLWVGEAERIYSEAAVTSSQRSTGGPPLPSLSNEALKNPNATILHTFIHFTWSVDS